MGATIDVVERTKRINAKGEAKRKAEISEEQAFYNDLIEFAKSEIRDILYALTERRTKKPTNGESK